MYRVTGLPLETFDHLFGLSDAELAQQGVQRVVADAKPGYPCRVSLEDAEPGEALLLLNFEHQPADTPYRSRHAIFVREGARATYRGDGMLPEQLRVRLLSLRAFDADHMMVDADVAEGREAEPVIERLLADPRTASIHVHFARRGGFGARIDRA